MYNRYIPQSDGSFHKNRVADQHVPQPLRPSAPPPPETSRPESVPHSCQHTNAAGFFRRILPKDFDTGDLLIVILLLLMAGDCDDDKTTTLLTLIIYFFM